MNTHTHNRNRHPSVGKYPDSPSAFPVRAMHGQTEEPSDDTAGGFSRMLHTLLPVLAVTVLSGIVFVTAMTLAAYYSPDPTALTVPLSAAALLLTALAVGITAGKCNPHRPTASALLAGFLLAAALTLLSLLCGGENDTLLPWLLRLAVMPAALLGGFLTRPKPKAPAHQVSRHTAHR